VKVSSVADGLVDVYDLTVEPTHLYAVRGLVVSNSKRVAMLDVNALLSHGAVETLRDAGAVRGQKNEDWWLQFMSGHTPADPRVPMVYEKFVNQLKAAGINVVRDGTQTQRHGPDDKDVDPCRGPGGPVGRHRHFDKDLKPVKGGLFDEQLTGGHGGKRWAHIKLPEPMPNPVMEEPIRRILGLTQKQFEAVLPASTTLPGFGTGPKAIAKALDPRPRQGDRTLAKPSGSPAGGGPRRRRPPLGLPEDAEAAGPAPPDWVMARSRSCRRRSARSAVMGDSGMPAGERPELPVQGAAGRQEELRGT
jgi:hypothetical protein